MTNPNIDETKMKAAADWFVINERDDLSEDNCAEFLEWLQADPENEIAYTYIEAIWESSAEIVNDKEFNQLVKTRPSENKRWFFAISSIAASFVLALGLWLSHFDNIHSTKVGEQKLFVLEDNSSIRINTDTRLKVALSKKERRIHLYHGEAFFVVAHDQNRPFIVEAGGRTVTALGTEFNVLQQENDYVVTVLEGKVAVSPVGLANNTGKPQEKPVLTAGEEVFYSNQQISTPQPGHLSRIIAWQAGKLDFDSETLGNVIKEVNRYSNKKIVIGDDALEPLLISGTFRVGNVDAIVKALSEALPILVEESVNLYRINPRPTQSDKEKPTPELI